MRQTNSPLLCFTLCLLGLILSCRKIDTFKDANTPSTAERFLDLPASISPEIKRIAWRLEELNKRSDFLNEIAKQNGFPIWDKAIIHSMTKPYQVGARTGSANDTIVYIPLVLHKNNHVTAFIYAKLNDTIKLQLHRANNYEFYGFGNVQESTNNAERLALQFMVLDNLVFGHKRFKLLDSRLFTNIGATPNNSKRILEIKNPDADGDISITNRSYGQWEEGTVTHCSWMTNRHCTGGISCEATCDYCELCVSTSWGCVTTVRYYFVPADDDENIGGGGNPSDGGDGGGGSGGSSPTGPTPCNPTPELDNGLPPCTKGGGDGWLPELEKPINPCDQVKSIINEPANTNYMQKVKELADAQNLNLNYEKSVSLIEGAIPNIKEESGTSSLASVQLPDLPTGQKYSSITHTHSNTIGGTYSVFSFGDLKRFSALMHSEQLEAGKFVAFLSTYKGTHYAITITDKTKFEDFFYHENNRGDAVQVDMTKWVNSHFKANSIEQKYFLDKVNPLIKETDTNNINVLDKFLDFMNEANFGITLFETNANFDTFTKIEKNQNGMIQRINCN